MFWKLPLHFSINKNCLCGLLVLAMSLPTALMASENLLSLSLKELLYVQVEKPYEGASIFQSDTNQVAKDTHNFGIIVPLATFPQYAAEIITGADLAADAINKAGGIDGHRLVIIRADDANSSKDAVRLSQQMIAEHGVTAIIGPNNSDAAEEVLKQVAIPKRVPLMTPSASADRLSDIQGVDQFWRLVASNRMQVKQLVKELVRLNRTESVFLVSGRGLYAEEVSEGIKSELAQLNQTLAGEIKLSSWINMEKIDLRAEVSQIEKSKPSAIVVTVKATIVYELLKQLEKQWRGDLPLILTGDMVKPQRFASKKVGDIKHCIKYLISEKSVDSSSPLQEKINQLLDVKNAGFDGAYVYDAVTLFAMAKQIEAALGTPFKQAMDALSSGGEPITDKDYPQIVELYRKHQRLQYQGLSGPIQFDQRGDNIRARIRLGSLISDDQPQPGCFSKLENSQAPSQSSNQ